MPRKKSLEPIDKPATDASDPTQNLSGDAATVAAVETDSTANVKRPISRAKKTSQAPVADESKSPLKRRRTVKTAKPPSLAESPAPILGGADDLPIPIWRPVGSAGTAPQSPAQPETRQEEAPKSRRRRSKEPAEEPELREALAKPAEAERKETRGRTRRKEPEVQPTPGPQPKALIGIPEDAPQVVLRRGLPTLVRSHRVYPALAFFGNAEDERKAATVFEEIRLAGEAGVHIHSLLVELEVDPRSVDVAGSFAAYVLKRAVEADPEAQVIFRVVFQAAKGWTKAYPDSVWTTVQDETAEPSVSDDAFWGVARNCLQALIRRLRLLPIADHILGVHLERGEWFLPDGIGYDNSKAAKAKFQEWCRARYLSDEVALRASWFDGSITFSTVSIPQYMPEGAEGDKFVRSSRKQRRYVDYHLFLSDVTHERIADLAYAAKEASEGRLLVGVSYGYTFEWSHPHSGHLSLGKVLRTQEIDFVAGPPSYRNREPGGTAPFPCPIDSFSLNGKLYLSEEDFKTAIGAGPEPDDFNPIIKTPQALESIHWRGIGAALAHGTGATWMDLWGNGWLKTAAIWERGARAVESLVRNMAVEVEDPDVAVFIDERALAYLVDPNAFKLLVQNAREAVLRAGMSAGFYLLSDLQHREQFPEAKLYLFLNAWDIRPELRSAIKSRLQRDGKVLFWLYSAGLFDAGRESIERAREVTGIAIKPQPFHSRAGTTLLNRRHILSDAFADKGMIGGARLEPSYFAINEDALVLGEYSQTGLPSFLVKEFRNPEDSSLNWTSVFLGEPVVNAALIRALGQMAGAHIWNFQDDVVHVSPPFLTVHCTGSGQRTITLPGKWSAYDLLAQEWAMAEATNIRFNGSDGSTHIFLVGVRAELEQILAASPSDLLHMEELPPRIENTVRFDAYSFDVPIMKLGEWIEGSVDEDQVEDWLLRPPVIEEDTEPISEVRTGSRRRRRRRGRGQNGRSPGVEEGADVRREGADVQAFEELDLSVRFRRRE